MLIDVKGGLVTVLAPAKLNLFLEVLGKRADGFHEIESLMCPISLCDTLELHSTANPEVSLELQLPVVEHPADNDPAWDIPSDERNLVYRAVQRVRDHLGVRLGCRIRLQKSIPAAAGLGGGSSDAAAAIVAAMIAWGNWDRELAAEVCAELGSDLNLFLGDRNGIGLALAKGRGEQCEFFACNPELEFVVTHPPAGCATSAVYAKCQISGQTRRSLELVQACQHENLAQIGALLFNALEPSAKSITPWIDKQLDFFRTFQLQYSVMTGSGSSCFALITEPYTMADMRRAANVAGLSRVYAVKSWSQPSIEDQLELVGSV
jgi:4-diphosphocytidyl-2-C-methyl-D-erythritol kinase